MNYLIVGLGNPGEEYEGTRHNAGRMVAEKFGDKELEAEWKFDKKVNARLAKGKLGKHSLSILLPETFMNLSGQAVKYLVKSKKDAEKMIVIHDDLDLPLGGMKFVKNRGSGGHKGVESIIRAVKTEDFVRLRIGVSKSTPKGKVRKPAGDDKVMKFIVGTFSPEEKKDFTKVQKKALEALTCLLADGLPKAMSLYNK